ncbi:MAG: DUF2970 domain-containing protein [Pseudomonadota bacterium]
MKAEESEQPCEPEPKGTGFWAVAHSVLAAGFGVQSRANRERDFTRGKASHFIIAGLIGTALFVLLVWGLVQLALRTL